MNAVHEVRILCDGLTEEDAYELEELVIGTVGRRYDDCGPLLNLSSGGKGGMTGCSVILTPEQAARRNAAIKSPEVRAKISAGVKASVRVLTPEGRATISKVHTGKTMSTKTRSKISKAKMGVCNYIPNAVQRAAISKRLTGRHVSEVTKRRISDGVKARGMTAEQEDRRRAATLRQVTCPHCKKSGARSIMMRWHFDNCKFKILENGNET